mgnify:CR=1 FL=1
MSSILTYIAVTQGKIKRSSLEVLSYCRTLANQNDLKLTALVADTSPEDFIDELKKYGPDLILTATGDGFEHHNNQPLLTVLADAIEQTNAKLATFASTEGAKDILGALGAKTGAAVLPDVTEFSLTESEVIAKRPVMANKIISHVQSNADLTLVSVRSGSYELNQQPGDADIESLSIADNDITSGAKLLEVMGSSGDKIDLSEAEIIVSAGRGVNDEDGKAMIADLADTLGAAIGASRALTEAGMYDPSLQIGQTGKIVSPQLYIAVGISGAVQHVAGMDKSKVIVAINKDPDAPIFDIADYGIVGDAYEVVPAFVEEIKKIKN